MNVYEDMWKELKELIKKDQPILYQTMLYMEEWHI